MESILRLAKEGFKFFPCLSNKAPATSNGFYDATNDIEKLETIFNNNNFLVGFPGGNLNKNIIIIDVDINKDGDTRTVDELLDALSEYGDIDRSGFQVETPSGGRHLYFKAPDEFIFSGGTRYFNKTLPIDIRATGQYAIYLQIIKIILFMILILKFQNFINIVLPCQNGL